MFLYNGEEEKHGGLRAPAPMCVQVEVRVPVEFQGGIIGDLNRRKGLILGSDQEADDTVVAAHVPLAEMFGYSTGLRSMTQVRACPGSAECGIPRCGSGLA